MTSASGKSAGSKRAPRRKKSYESKIAYRLREIPIDQITVWKEAQARELDREGIAELARSIKSEGLQNPPMLQKEGKDRYLLMSGQRRLAALKRLRAKKIPALVLTRDSSHELDEAKAVSVVENMHRNKMNVRDTAASCKYLAEQMGHSKAARSLGLSVQTFRKYLGFSAVPEKIKDLVPGSISRDEATKLYQAVPNVPSALRIAEKISRLDSKTRRNYIAALARSPRSGHKVLLKRARSMAVSQNVAFKLPKTLAKRLASKAGRSDVMPNELASQIITGWLKRKQR